MARAGPRGEAATVTVPRPGTPAADAIPALLAQHGPRLYALAKRLCGNPEDASDMVQDAFLQAYRKWHTFKGDSQPGTWLYAIAARSCSERMRRKGGTNRRMPAMSQLMPWSEQRGSGLIQAANGRELQPVERVLRREAREAVHAAILGLPDHFRLPLILKEMLELPVEDVARILNIRPETVKTRLHRARMLIRKDMLRGIPGRPAAPAAYEKRVCMDLLRAKLDAMDQGRGFPIGQDVVCRRCRTVFAELDLAQDACADLASGRLPQRIRTRILTAVQSESPGATPGMSGNHAAGGERSRPRRGARPGAPPESSRGREPADR